MNGMATGTLAIRAAAALSLALLLAVGRVAAQEVPEEPVPGVGTDVEDLEPGVDTSAGEGEAPAPADEVADETEVEDEETEAEEVTRVESGGQVMDRMELGRTEITGSQELPKVLYIVPWQKAQHGDLSGKPVNTLIDEVLAPVDREEFIRTVDYYGELHGAPGE
jgi:hypothetical protein